MKKIKKYVENFFKTTLDEFVVMVNNKKEIVYVNDSVPQSDVDDFMKYITYMRLVTVKFYKPEK